MKKKLTSLILSLALILTCVPTVASAAEGTLITEGYNDEHIIPDKYNTGCDESVELTPATGGQVVENGPYLRVDDGVSIYFDFNDSKNKNLNGTFTIENVDFSGYTTKGGGVGNAWGYAGEGITIRYINCKFGNYIDQNTAGYSINAEFINCSFISAQSANSTFNNCYFGGPTNRDPLTPYYNCTFNNCYISDVIYKTAEQGNDHVDGMQTLYGQDLYFNNCRWEVPDINYTYKNGGFSYIIYIQPQNGDAENVILDHCYLNGGGHYAISVAQSDVTDCNIRIIEPFIGYCYQSSTPYYPLESNSAEAVTENPHLHDSLYVSSVWKGDDNKLHFLVTNDTGVDRTLSVYTNEGLTTFTVPRTYRPSEYEADTKDFEDLPIDIEHEIAIDAEYAVFYDTTEEAASTENQIRYVNYSDKAVYRMSDGSHITSENQRVLVTEQYRDTVIIPDKYNTGLSNPELCTKKMACGTYADNGVYIRNNQSTSGVSNEDSTSYLIQFANNSQPTSNKSLSGEYVFENYDFATDGIQIGVTGRYNAQNPVKFVFRNCKFALWKGYDEIHTSDGECLVETVFENCSFESFSDSHSTLNNCYFGNTSANTAGKDGINPLNNCTFNNCFISNLVKPIADNGLHVDGMQSNCCQDIVFNNCRWEIPKLNLSQSCGVTAAVFVQPKETDDETGETILSNFRFNDCYINGGGVYEIQLPETGHEGELSFSNCVFGECYTGKRVFYYENSQELFCDDTCKNVDSLYVSSVWKDSNQRVHLSVTNDTREERTLLVCTSNGNYTFDVPKMLICDEMEVDSTTYEDMPFDIELILPETDYIVCYDMTDEVNPQQIRFVNYTSEDIYVDLDAESTEITVPATPVIPEGDILFNANISSVFEIKIPNQIALNKEVNEIELLATADIGGTETLSIETPNIVTLTSKNNEIYDAGVNLSQSILTSSELFTGKRVTMIIDCSELLPGEWNGAIDIQFVLR